MARYPSLTTRALMVENVVQTRLDPIFFSKTDPDLLFYGQAIYLKYYSQRDNINLHLNEKGMVEYDTTL